MRAAFRSRSKLVILVVAALVPLLVFSAFIVYRNAAKQHELREQGMRDTVRALSLAADGEVKAAAAVLHTLAASSYLDARDFQSFHRLCVMALAGRQGAWVVLFDPSGQQIVNSSRPFGAPLPNPLRDTQAVAAAVGYPRLALGGAAPVRKVLDTRQSVVSDLFVGLDSRKPAIGVGIPVVRDGVVRYVLEMSVDPDSVLQMLRSQQLPQQSIAAVLDGNGNVIARTLESRESVGQPLMPELAHQVSKAPAGSGAARMRDGTLVYHAHTRSNVTGWIVSLAVPQAPVSAQSREAIFLLVGGAALAMLVAFLAAPRTRPS